ncbi:hypothetical protein BP5796_02130 [Coleophoma crateriformis]|uniref:U-box domain-containing protein n=1 Tax=Coleophoma crateriformis TaxID=565419 RepID=A0A3D8SXC6_9HELO|nr:hypothetical protein BP5796_02130 [Coleophoma crateriformis]
MAGEQYPQSPEKSLEYKNQGNRSFQSGDYSTAEELYTKAIQHDTSNPLLYTNRSLASLKLAHYPLVVSDCQTCIALAPPVTTLLKAYYQLAQALQNTSQPIDALKAALKAHELCLDEICTGGKGANNIGPITELVLRCKKESWEVKEREREAREGGLLQDCIRGLEASGMEPGVLASKIEDLRKTFEDAGHKEARRREVPDWCIDDISFAVMVDPVVTKTGQSYARASIMEHLKRSSTDPLTREPLKLEDLRPNLALKSACAEFLDENGWAVDW